MGTPRSIVVSQAQLDATRASYQGGNSVIVSQVNKAMASNYGSLTYTVQGPWPGGINQCGASSNPNNGCSEADNDSNAAYVQALLWYMTSNQTYANNAINIMNTYASNFKGYAWAPMDFPVRSGTDCSNGPCNQGGTPEKWPRAWPRSFAGAGPVAAVQAGLRRISRLSPTCW